MGNLGFSRGDGICEGISWWLFCLYFGSWMVTVGITILTSGWLVLSKLSEAILYTVSEGINLVAVFEIK